ncbi:MAG TPA: MerR family transcriptional regulator [Acidimicrobiales bacterium]|nr:MerR family transcriptional regulator [Acidimicrobiales bacterium]
MAERMTVDELARRAGTTTRNVRNYQTQGLLPPPELEGRTGYYDEGHLGRLRLIAQLQHQGFSLAGIAELLKAWEQGRSLADLLGFEEALTAPWTDEQPEFMTLVELAEMFPQAADDPALAIRAMDLGLFVPHEDGFLIPSPSLLRAGAELAAVGVPLADTQDALAALRDDMARIAARFVGMFERYVWKPYVEAGMPSERLPEVTDALRRMRPLAATSVQATLAQAMQRASAASTAASAVGAAAERPPVDNVVGMVRPIKEVS